MSKRLHRNKMERSRDTRQRVVYKPTAGCFAQIHRQSCPNESKEISVVIVSNIHFIFLFSPIGFSFSFLRAFLFYEASGCSFLYSPLPLFYSVGKLNIVCMVTRIVIIAVNSSPVVCRVCCKIRRVFVMPRAC